MLNKLLSAFGAPNKHNLSGAQFKTLFGQTKGAVLLDVRTPGEFAGGHLSGAKNIDFMSSDFLSKIRKLDNTKTYFLYCRSGGRSGQACAQMAELGYSVYNLSGGISAWPR